MQNAFVKSQVAKNLVNLVLDPLGFAYPRAYLRYLDDAKYVHFLHIGRNAGTTIKEFNDAVGAAGQGVAIMAHDHKVGLADLPEQANYFFSVRDPIERFYSAFYWRRKRRDQAEEGDSYSEQERKAFSRFREANELAETLFADGTAGLHAITAMQDIKHVKRPQHSWFPTVEEVLDRRPPLCIVRLERMRGDLGFLCSRFGLDIDTVWPEKEARHRHKNNDSDRPALSPKAVENLRRWYAADFQFYRLAMDWIAANQDKSEAAKGAAPKAAALGAPHVTRG
jgi:hypothetical protein